MQRANGDTSVRSKKSQSKNDDFWRSWEDARGRYDLHFELCFMRGLEPRGHMCRQPHTATESDMWLSCQSSVGAWAARHLTLINLFALTKAASEAAPRKAQ